ncbi:MAG TPA: DNA-formamidopyrimidine glycosylase family protein [Pyrinomonadaceae bacterium]|jgi:formamidopyrimidine-DNA glycosylase|nr:DNA-formamidopyrimidine glycosylase family protein [Pyrinomonadaceae bacterium]
MPEGPEVRKYADALDAVLTGRVITSLTARTREARAWLQGNEKRLRGRRISRVFSHGKHLIGLIEGGFFFHSHLMMWGRWQTFGPEAPVEKDRRERARIVVEGGAALLFSAPIFNVGEGDPYRLIENLASLGPDVIPYDGDFGEVEFRRRLLLPEHHEITIGAALLNQRILAGLGNYLRAEVLFSCRLNPWRKVEALTKKDLQCLTKTAPALARRAYEHSATASDAERDRMRNDMALVYQPGREYGTRHLVFRRTNLPCLQCGEPIKQLRQKTFNAELTGNEEDGESKPEERTRIVYFCAKCQKVKTDAAEDLRETGGS